MAGDGKIQGRIPPDSQGRSAQAASRARRQVPRHAHHSLLNFIFGEHLGAPLTLL
jgi:hypothetical protein